MSSKAKLLLFAVIVVVPVVSVFSLRYFIKRDLPAARAEAASPNNSDRKSTRLNSSHT